MTDINQFIRFNLIKDSKNPTYEWHTNYRHKWRTGVFSGNSGIPTGKQNNITVIDLDFYKIKEESNKFIEQFNNYIEHFDTLTVKSGGGGIHLYFQYDTDITQTRNDTYHIDIRGEGGYIVSPGSIVDGKPYTVYHNATIKKMPKDIKNWLLDNIYPISKSSKLKKEIDRPKQQTDKKKIRMICSKYNLTNDMVINHIQNLPDKYWSNNDNLFLKYTTFCKYFDQFDLWDEMNQKHDGYDKNNNIKCFWEPAQPTEEIIDLVLGEYIDYYKYKPILPNKQKPDRIISNKKLGYDFINDQHNLIVRSDTGTGKTTAFKHYVKSNGLKFISIVSRISLADEQYNVFSEHGITCKNYRINNDLLNGDNIIITIDSIRKLYLVDVSEYVIFLDEYNSILEYMTTAQTLSKYRSCIYKKFVSIIKKCRQVIATDADINDISINWMRQYKSNIEYIQNTYKHNQNVLAYEIKTFTHLIERLHKEDTFLLCTDSRTNAELVFKTLDDPTICLIIGGDDTYYKLDDYKKVIFSPKIMYGIDSSMKRNVYCYYTEQTIQPTGYLQQIARCRDINILYYLFDKKKYTYKENSFDDHQNLIYKQNILGCRYFKDEADPNDYIEYQNLLNRYTYNSYCYESNKFAHFRTLLIERGFKLELNNMFIRQTDRTVKQLKKEMKQEKTDNFDVSKYQKIHDILKVPADHIEQFKEYYIDQFKLKKHFNLMNMIHQSTEDLKYNLNECNHDYLVNRITIDKTKILYLKKLKSYMNDHSDLHITIDKDISTTDRQILFEEYNIIFRNRSTKKTFDTNQHIFEFVAKIYGDLFGDDILKISKKKLARGTDGKRKDIRCYQINQDTLNRHQQLYDFRHTDNTTSLF